MELRDYIAVVRRHWVTVIATGIIVAVLAAVFSFMQTPQYASTTRLFVTTTSDDSDAAYQGGLFSTQRVQSYVSLATSQGVTERVIDRLDLDVTPEALATQVTAEAEAETVNLTITVQDQDPARAQEIAQAYADGLRELVRELETPDGKKSAPIKVTVVDDASFSDTPVSPKPLRNIGLGLVLGLLLGIGLAVLRDVLDTRVKSESDVQQITDAPVLGAIDYDPTTANQPLISDLETYAPRVEAFRVLRTNLQFVDVDHKRQVIVVTSAVPTEGKSTTAVNVAISFAEAGHRTLLIEGDLRRSRAVEMLGMDRAIGLTDVLISRVRAEAVIQRHGQSGLDVLASGTLAPNPAELLQSQAMASLLEDLRDRYDLVIIDAPPLLPVTDAALLARQADGNLLVVRHGHVTRDQVAQALSRLEKVDAAVIGVVMSMVPRGKSGSGYGYRYGYQPTSSHRRKDIPVAGQPHGAESKSG